MAEDRLSYKRALVDLAPDVVEECDIALQDTGCTEIQSNLRADEMFAPEVGPAHPWRAPDAAYRNNHAGFYEESYMNEHMFHENYKKALKNTQFSEWKNKKKAKDPRKLEAEANERKKAAENDEDTIVTAGGEVIKKEDLKLVETKTGEVAKVDEEDDGHIEGRTMYWTERKGEKQRRVVACDPSFVRHVDTLFDYQGRNIVLDPPSKSTSPQCYLPKKLKLTYRGHNKGVHVLRWLPPSGHMFASGGLEGKVKLWETDTAKPIHTYIGHELGVKDIAFNFDGSKFLSTAHDRFIREWDTETGQVLGTYSNGSLANVIKYHPDPSKSHEFFAGCSDYQLHQFDTSSGTIIRSYDQHLGAVNTCTFIDSGRKIVTTSDDKTIRIWEMDLPVTIKQVSDPAMHSLPSATMHPTGRFFGLQSMDNQILMYTAGDRFQLHRKKRFSGHLTAGYACEVGFSHDGSFVSSGNGNGELFIWNWKNCRMVKHFKCHDKVLISHIWHPTESSQVLTSSWDSTIKLWD